MSGPVSYALSVALLFIAAAVLPWAVMRALLPTLESSSATVENYRGRRVTHGLGLVWIVWTISLLLLSFVDVLYANFFSQEGVPLFGDFGLEGLPFLLVLGALILGFADDVYGSKDKGFRGHLKALRQGRLTTGGLKFLGIGLLACVTVTPDFGSVDMPVWTALGIWALQAVAIALTANLINLMDLRPGRALKSYGGLAVIACVIGGYSSGWFLVPYLGFVLFGPLAAVWGPDLHERGMLGDSGANAAGVLLGWLMVNVLSGWWWALLIYAVVVLGLNLLSEKVSFSIAIESNSALRWLDGLGRLPAKTGDRCES